MELSKQTVQGVGKLYGVGVGPGDPELLTLKAVRIINDVEVIAFPGKLKEETVAYQIVEAVLQESENKEFLSCPVVMTKDQAVLDASYDGIADAIANKLEQGKAVAFLTIGDPTIYSTYMYVHKRVKKLGYPVEIISGIPSFCAAAARLDISLSERSEMLHIVPSSYDVAEALELEGTKVLMKAGSKMGDLREQLMEHEGEVYMVENCGLPQERICKSAGEIKEKVGYLSLIVVKDRH